MQISIGILLFHIALVCGLTCDELLELPPEQKISEASLHSMLPKHIVQCVANLGQERLPPSEAEFVWKSIIKFYEGIENIPNEILSILHWITVAITPEDYTNMTLSDIDIIQNFGLNYNLSEAQLLALAIRARQDFAQKEPEDYTYYDLTALRQILCAYNRTDIERIPASSYKEAALMIGKLEKCRGEAMSGFATLAIQKKGFGPLREWTQDTFDIVGKVADYLP